MFDKLEDLLIRYEELMSELSEPDALPTGTILPLQNRMSQA